MEMQSPQTPVPPWGSNPRREIPPSVLSPSFSRSAFHASDAGVDEDADVSEHPCVRLLEWWLARKEGDDEKIAVAGIFERNQTPCEFAPARIAKRHDSCVLETEDGIVLLIHGSPHLKRTEACGYSIKVCEDFMLGFPLWWQNYNQLHPKETSLHEGRRPISSNNSNSNNDTTRFYLEQFQLGERVHLHGLSLLSKLAKCSSNNDDAFQKSSHLPNGAPRFEEYTSDDNIANENVGASNDDGERHEAPCNEVYIVETHLVAGRALGERDDDIGTVDCANDAGNEEADNATPSSTCDQRKAQHVSPSKKAAGNEDVPTSVCLETQNSYRPNRTPRFEEYTCDGDRAILKDAAASNDGGGHEAVCNEVDIVETVLTSAVECANDASNEEADNAASTSDKRNPMVSAAINDEMPTSVCLDVQNSSDMSNGTPRFEKNTCVGDIPTNGDAAAFNDNSERCTAAPKEVDSIEEGLVVDSIIRGRAHDDITNVPLAPTVECTVDAVSEGVHNNPLLGCKQTPVASLTTQDCQERHQGTPSNEKPSGPPKKQRSALKKLERFTSSVPYAFEPRQARGWDTSLSLSTPEDLKLKKTRSGRVVVPTLDKGCQRIVYDMDGTIAGIVGLDSPSPKGSKLKASTTKNAEPAAAPKLKTYSRKRSAEPAAASKLKTYARKRSAEPAAASKLKTDAAKKRRAA